MQTINYKSHVFNLVPADLSNPGASVDIYCSNIFLLRADPALHPLFSLQLWLDRAVELVKLLNLQFSC